MAQLAETEHALQILLEYEYLLRLWADNVQKADIDYFAMEALLQSIAEQQDVVNASAIAEHTHTTDKLNTILQKVELQLQVNARITEKLLASDSVSSINNDPHQVSVANNQFR